MENLNEKKEGELLTSSECSTDLREIWQGVRTRLAVSFCQTGWCDFAQFLPTKRKPMLNFPLKFLDNYSINFEPFKNQDFLTLGKMKKNYTKYDH